MKKEIQSAEVVEPIARDAAFGIASPEASQARRELNEDMRAALMGRFHISQPREGVVELALGNNCPVAFIRGALKAATAFSSRPAIAEGALAAWATDERFLARGPSDLVVRVEGYVPGSAGLTLEAMRRDGMADVSVAHLAAAHLAYRVASRGGDLFRGYHVIGSDGVLNAGPFGLNEYKGIFETGGHELVGACRTWKR
ncbi:MAG: hypothetical protein RL417_2601 [Pseudomonadota bacterium]